MNYDSLLLVFAIFMFVLLLIIGRALFMWWFGTGEIVQQNKEIIRLLTIIADTAQQPPPAINTKTVSFTDPKYALQSAQPTNPKR